MFKRFGLVIALGLTAGCWSDRPHEYGNQRPPVDEIDSRDRGLQSKDVVASSDQMAMDILAMPELNADKSRWLIVVSDVENRTTNNRFDLNIFIERLRVNLSKHGRGRVQLIENRDKLKELQSKELEQPVAAPAGLQPDFGLYGKIMELPNKGTSYFLCEFSLTDMHTREQVWTNAYEVKVEK